MGKYFKVSPGVTGAWRTGLGEKLLPHRGGAKYGVGKAIPQMRGMTPNGHGSSAYPANLHRHWCRAAGR